MKLSSTSPFLLLLTSVAAFSRNNGDENDAAGRQLFARTPESPPGDDGRRSLETVSWASHYSSGSGSFVPPSSGSGSSSSGKAGSKGSKSKGSKGKAGKGKGSSKGSKSTGKGYSHHHSKASKGKGHSKGSKNGGSYHYAAPQASGSVADSFDSGSVVTATSGSGSVEHVVVDSGSVAAMHMISGSAEHFNSGSVAATHTSSGSADHFDSGSVATSFDSGSAILMGSGAADSGSVMMAGSESTHEEVSYHHSGSASSVGSGSVSYDSSSKGSKGSKSGKGGKGGSKSGKSGKGGKGGSKSGKSGKGDKGSKGSSSSHYHAGSGSFESGSTASYHSGSESYRHGRELQNVPSSCQRIPIFFYVEDLKLKFNKTATGGSFNKVDFYYKENGDLLGHYSDESTSFADGDCVGSGTFSFGVKSPYPSQISTQFTCTGRQNSITGGNGDFGCASGLEVFTFDDGIVTESELLICKDLCPYKQWSP